MLDVLRKHASSWIIKFLLGAIVISFIFFFGYSSMRSSMSGKGPDAVATVNGRPISAAEYKFVLANNYDSLKSTFKDQPVPEFVQQMARSQTMRQLVTRELALQLAENLGVVVPDAELADTIKQSPYAQRDGTFDPAYYKNQFLPYFKQRFDLDYETFLRQDITLEMLESIFKSVDVGEMESVGSKEKEKTYSWTFESVTIDPAELLKKGKIASADEALSAAELLITSDPVKWQGLASPLGASPVKRGPLSLRERTTLLGGQGTLDDMLEIFSLTPEKPVIKKPFERAGKIYVVRLVERKEVDAGSPFWPGRDFFRSWMSKLSEEAKVVSFMKEEE
jgi:hypothetical protein